MIIRRATPDDAQVLAQLIRDLAAYEGRSDHARPNVDALRRDLDASSSPHCEAFLAVEEEDPVGFAFFYPTYSTFRTNWGIRLEDLYVKDAYRGQGVGRALMERLAEEAAREGYLWLEWHVLHWNESAVAFYERLGAQRVKDWMMMYLSEGTLKRLAQNT